MSNISLCNWIKRMGEKARYEKMQWTSAYSTWSPRNIGPILAEINWRKQKKKKKCRLMSQKVLRNHKNPVEWCFYSWALHSEDGEFTGFLKYYRETGKPKSCWKVQKLEEFWMTPKESSAGDGDYRQAADQLARLILPSPQIPSKWNTPDL